MARYVIDNRPGSALFNTGGDDTARTILNAKNLIMTMRGEIPYNRSCGFDEALFDLPINELNERLIEAIDEALEYEPDAEAVEAKAWIGESGETVIQAVIEVAENE